MSASPTTDLWRMSAIELAQAIKDGQTSSQEVVEAHLRRIEAVNPSVNAVPVVMAERALDAAQAADRAIAAGADLLPLHGVPFIVKSNIDVVGTPTSQGAKALVNAFPHLDAPVVERLKAAGAIPIAGANMPTYAMRWHCESELWGATINPWDRSRTAGASSAGVAVALATGMSPVGLGNDGLGSLRHPAQCCGVVALKPTLGRIPDATTTGPQDSPIGVQLTAVQGPLARRVSDLRAAFEALAGPTWRDPWTVPAPLRGPGHPMPLRVALVLDPAGLGVAKQVQLGVRKAARALADAGYIVEEVEPPSIDLAAKALLDMLNPPGIRPDDWELMFPSLPDETRRFLSQFYAYAGAPDPVAHMRSFMTRHALLRAWSEFQETRPLIVAPVSTELPFKAGTDLSEGRVAAEIQSMRMTIAVNALGLPAVAVPVGVMDGLPQVAQIIGPRYREDLCLDAAAAIEDRLGVITPIDPR